VESSKQVAQISIGTFPPGFIETLGHFHCIWLMFDVTLDFAIGYFLAIDFEETHILVSGLEFGRKLRLLVELLKRSKHDKKDILIESIKTIQASKRDIITHSYIASNTTNISFVYKSRGEFKSGRLEFHIDDFTNHVAKIIQATQRFQNSLGVSDETIGHFANTVLSMQKS
jgi:hypothetical protein